MDKQSTRGNIGTIGVTGHQGESGIRPESLVHKLGFSSKPVEQTSTPKPKGPPKVTRSTRYKSYWKMRKIGHLWE